MVKRFCLLVLLVIISAALKAQAPRVLVVMAHPDDESTFSVTLYKIAKEHHGMVDLFVITNGEAGFKYSTLAETYYGMPLTDEPIGRAKLPAIRKRELKEAGKILGIHRYFFSGQPDNRYTLDEKEPLDTSWHVQAIKGQLKKIIQKNDYDLVFCLLPDPNTHGQHKAATLLALDVISELPSANRPVILGAVTESKAGPLCRFSQYRNYSSTRTLTDTASFRIDRNASFSYKHRISYKIIANWEIAAHRSQGFTEMTFNEGDSEAFWFFMVNDPSQYDKTMALFNTLHVVPYAIKDY